MSNWLSGGWIQTYTGRKFFPLDPRIDDICIEDIAHALSNICRYGGHCREFYSVAQHCCMVCDFIPAFKLEGLMHDSTEAYLGDMIRPVKHDPRMVPYRDAEHHLEEKINAAFNLVSSPDVKQLIKHYDNRALFTERKFMLQELNWSNPVEPLPVICLEGWSPQFAEEQFLIRFKRLYA